MDAMNRRNFLKLSSVSLSLLALEAVLPEVAQAKEKPTDDLKLIQENGLSILQGLTNETSTQLSIDVLKTMKVNYELIEISSGRKFEPVYLKSASRKSVKWRVDKIGYKDLPILSEFKFRVLDQKGLVLDERFLKLLDTQKADPRIVFASCMNDMNKNYSKIWPVVEKSNPDLLIFMGDNCYGDIIAVFDGPDLLWNRYIETRQSVPFYHWKNLKPVLCIWDDHDFGLNNADGNYKHKKDSLATFNAFSAQEPIIENFERGPGASSFFKAFGHKFVLLDNRYFKRLKYDGIQGFLGKEQLDWAFNLLSHGNEPNILI